MDLRGRLSVESVEVNECLRWWIKAGLVDDKLWDLLNEQSTPADSDVEVLNVELYDNEEDLYGD
jgi:hypothetical protein